jgi:hypothetical protein
MKSRSLLATLLLLASHLCPAQQPANTADTPTTYEQHKQAAIRINDLVGQIHSEADASAIVSEIATMFAKELPPAWASAGIRDRIAHAEHQAVSDPAKLIPERRVVEVWNQYVKEIGAPDEAIVSAAEIHNMRDASYTYAQLMWARGFQNIWTMPNVFALGPDGKVADGCRPLEALRLIHDLAGLFQNLRSARDRLRKGIVASEQIKKSTGAPNPLVQGNAQLLAKSNPNPTAAAERRYAQEHSSETYYLLLKRLFDELFPAD